MIDGPEVRDDAEHAGKRAQKHRQAVALSDPERLPRAPQHKDRDQRGDQIPEKDLLHDRQCPRESHKNRHQRKARRSEHNE